jgi:hypothetical protein
MSVRDRGLERAVLARAERDSGVVDSDYDEIVVSRLDHVTRERGDSFDDRSLLELVAEIGSEAVDLGGWALLALTNLSVLDAPAAQRERLQAALEALVTVGTEAHQLVQRAAQTARMWEMA